MQEEKPPEGKTRPFGARFRELRSRLGLTQEQIARRLGVTTATYNRYEKGHRDPSASLLQRMAGLAPGVNAEWLLNGQGAMYGSEAEQDAAPALMRVPALGSAFSPEDLEKAPPSAAVAFGRDWIRQELKCDPSRVFLMDMGGDSMAPTLLPGEMLLVRRQEREPIGDGIHVLNVGGAIQVRRLQWVSTDALEAVADNPLYKSRTLSSAEAARSGIVIGRVLWSGKRY